MSQRPPLLRVLVVAGAALVVGLVATRLLAPPRGDRPVVFAASSLADFLLEAGEFYKLDRASDMDVHFGASTLLQRQIEKGGGADLFISASPREVDALAAAGLVAHRATLFRNRLVLIEREDREGWRERLQAGTKIFEGDALGTLAIGEPEVVPAGRYARDALRHIGAWDRVAPVVVRGTNVRQVLEYVRRGQADMGIVYRTDKRQGEGLRSIVVFDEATHPPIEYVGAIVKGGKHPELARSFLDWLAIPERRRLIRKHGFVTTE